MSAYQNVTFDDLLLQAFVDRDPISRIIDDYQVAVRHKALNEGNEIVQIDAVKVDWDHEIAHQVLRWAGGITDPRVMQEKKLVYTPPELEETGVFDDNLYAELIVLSHIQSFFFRHPAFC